MPVNNNFPTLDGVAPSWADSVVTLSTTGGTVLTVEDIKAINTSRTVEVGSQKAGGRVMKTTAGDGSQEASMTLYRTGWQKLLRAAKAEAPLRSNVRLISLVHFNVNHQYTPFGDTEIYERRLKGCRIVGDSANGSEGTDAAEVEVTLNVKVIQDMVDGEPCELI